MAEPSNSITLHSFGGLGAQLLVCSYAAWIGTNLQRDVHVVCHTGGISLRRIEVSSLLETKTFSRLGVTHSVVDDYPRKSAVARLRRLKSSIFHRLRSGESAPHPSGVMEPPVATLESLGQMDVLETDVVGSLLDWRVPEAVLPVLESALLEAGLPNFLGSPEQQNVVAAHWRLGDYLLADAATEFHGVVSPNSLAQAIRYANRTMSDRVVVVTDSPEVARPALVESGLVDSLEIRSTSIWADLQLLSGADALVCSHSSVSMWAALSQGYRGNASSVLMPDRFTRNEMSATMRWPTMAKHFAFFGVEFCSESEITTLRGLVHGPKLS